MSSQNISAVYPEDVPIVSGEAGMNSLTLIIPRQKALATTEALEGQRLGAQTAAQTGGDQVWRHRMFQGTSRTGRAECTEVHTHKHICTHITRAMSVSKANVFPGLKNKPERDGTPGQELSLKDVSLE